MRWPEISGSRILSRRIDEDAARLWRVVRDHPEPVVVGLGVFLRIVTYLSNRAFWMDEGSLWGNLAGKRAFDFAEPLRGDQLAPIGFLIAQRALMAVMGTSTLASRLIPLICAIAGLFLFWRVTARILPRRPALIALVLFALSDDLIYYSSELKPYSMDLAVGLAITLAAIDSVPGSLSLRRAAVLALAAVAAPWFSFASAFVVGGCGATLIVGSLRAGQWRDSTIWVLIAIAWLASLYLSYRASSALLSPYTTMYIFWHFAFLPVWPWPISLSRLVATAGILLETFVNPLNLLAPSWPRAAVIFPIVLLLGGGASLARRSWPAWAILVLPIALAVVASALGRYPLHGRLILELVPALFLLIAEGTEWLRTWDRGRIKLGYATVLIVLLAYPCIAGFQQAAAVTMRDFNSHGDLHKNRFIT